MNYEEMTPKELSIAVLKEYKPEIFERDIKIADIGDGGIAVFENGLVGAHALLFAFNASRPDDAWPIIFENKISTSPTGDLWICGSSVFGTQTIGEDPLLAAMICFLKMKDAEK